MYFDIDASNRFSSWIYFAVLRDIESFGIRFKRDSEDYNKRMKEVLKWFLPADFVDGSEVT